MTLVGALQLANKLYQQSGDVQGSDRSSVNILSWNEKKEILNGGVWLWCGFTAEKYR